MTRRAGLSLHRIALGFGRGCSALYVLALVRAEKFLSCYCGLTLQTLSVRLDGPALRWLGSFSPGVWLLQTLPPSGWRSTVVPASGGKDRPA